MEQQMPAAKEEIRQEEFDPNEWAREKGLTRKQKRKVFSKAAKQNGRNITPSTGRLASRSRTGTTPHFALWQADLKLKSALQRLKLNKLADSTEDSTTAAGFALLYVSGVKTVYAVTQCSIEDLVKVKGITPDHLQAVEVYLVSRNVKPAWSTFDGN